jgi:DNA adenine methylase
LATLTPFRYPGSKSKLLPVLMPHIDKMLTGCNSFADAFVGGGSVLLQVATKYPKLQLHLNDKDRGVYCFWKIIADSNRSQLDQLLSLMQTVPTINLFNQLRKDADQADEVAWAYRCIFFNRTAFSGIAMSGPIGGQEQKSKWGVACRYNASKLTAKIEKCRLLLQDRTIVENKSIESYSYITDHHAPLYLDPPYYIAGGSLYKEKMSQLDHQKLAELLKPRSNWVLSYDEHSDIKTLYQNQLITTVPVKYCINGQKSDWKSKNELIISP